MSYGAVPHIALFPSPRWEGDYLHGIRPTHQQVHISIAGHHLQARDDGSIRVGNQHFALPTAGSGIRQAALEILQTLEVLGTERRVE